MLSLSYRWRKLIDLKFEIFWKIFVYIKKKAKSESSIYLSKCRDSNEGCLWWTLRDMTCKTCEDRICGYNLVEFQRK